MAGEQNFSVHSIQIKKLLDSYYYAVGIPIALYFGKSSPFYQTEEFFGVLEEQQGEILDLLRRTDLSDNSDFETVTDSSGRFAAVSVRSNRSQQNSCYLLILFDGENISAEKRKAACDLLHPLASYIVSKNLLTGFHQQHVAAFRQIVWDHPEYDWSMENLMELLHISRTQLYQQFREYAGMSVADYIRSIRLEKAKFLLQNSNLSITEISSIIGFNDYNYFLRVFKKEFGISARGFRKQSHSLKK